MRHARWAALVLVVFASMLFWCSGVWLDRALASASQGVWRVSAPSGTLWQGQGQLIRFGEDGSVTALARVHWRFLPQSLSPVQLSWSLGQGDETGDLSLTWQGWQVSGLVESI